MGRQIHVTEILDLLLLLCLLFTGPCGSVKSKARSSGLWLDLDTPTLQDYLTHRARRSAAYCIASNHLLPIGVSGSARSNDHHRWQNQMNDGRGIVPENSRDGAIKQNDERENSQPCNDDGGINDIS